ncbi:MAG TPA: hypothetical protein P5262_03295 [Candidatus Moranbacteria bacterium]|nr:hypothetical protein [Candidatus Moranbacteria bacterium]
MINERFLADEVAAELKKVKNFCSACSVVFEREKIPSSQWPDLFSFMGKELGRRGGIKSGIIRRNKKEKIKKVEKKIMHIFNDWQIEIMIAESLEIIGERSDYLLDP